MFDRMISGLIGLGLILGLLFAGVFHLLLWLFRHVTIGWH